MDSRKAEKLAKLQEMIDSVPSDGGGELEMILGPVTPRKKVPRGNQSPEQDTVKECLSEEQAFRKIVELCSYHEFCQVKMHDKLKRAGARDDVIDAAIGQAVRIGLIDDLRWGEMRASALMRKGVGSDGIVRDLRDHGIEASRVDGWPHAFIERYGDDFERALSVVRKSLPKAKNARASAYAKLVRKGYAPDIAAQVSGAWFDESMASGMR